MYCLLHAGILMNLLLQRLTDHSSYLRSQVIRSYNFIFAVCPIAAEGSEAKEMFFFYRPTSASDSHSVKQIDATGSKGAFSMSYNSTVYIGTNLFWALKDSPRSAAKDIRSRRP